MKKFDASFKDGLRKAVEDVESTSGVELVVTIIPKTSNHIGVHLGLGLSLAFIALSILMFIHIEFWYVLIYIETLVAFLLGFSLPYLFPGLKRLLIGKKRRKELALLHSRALFQAAGIRKTEERIGILVTFCWREQEVIVLADNGAEELVPPDEMEAFDKRLEEVFSAPEPPEKLIEIIRDSKQIFEIYIPRSVDDVNELPDELWLH